MSPQQQAELVAEIQNNENPDNPHFDEPLQVIPLKDSEGKWLVLGGEHRTKAMTALDQEQIPCVVRSDLANKSRKELMLWSVRRNNLRGRINAQKYAELEDELINDHDMNVEAARRSMLIAGDLANALRASLTSTKDASSTDGGGESSGEPDVDYEKSADNSTEEKRSRAELLQALKLAEQDVLLDSADTVPFGYLFFMQGREGQSHLVVDETNRLHDLVSKMVSACKGVPASVDDFLSAAIQNELANWE